MGRVETGGPAGLDHGTVSNAVGRAAESKDRGLGAALNEAVAETENP